MLRTDFAYLLENKLLVIEGSLTSELQRRTRSAGALTPRYLLDDPDMISQIHQDFARAGARILVAGTGQANRVVLDGKMLGDHFEEINRKAVDLCRKALPPEGLLFAGIGTTLALLKPYGQFTEEDYLEVYREQGELLLSCGVDGFILQGFSSLIEAEQCIIALREICSKPVVATMTFLEDGLTKFGDSMEECFTALCQKGADVVGIHGTLGPLEIDNFLAGLKKSWPLCIRPNAGYPLRIGGAMTFLSSPEYVAECAEMFVDRGALIIGGAAGFTPDHIAAVAESLRGKSPVKPVAGGDKQKKTNIFGGNSAEDATKAGQKTLGEKLGRQPVISVELEPPKGLDTDSIISLLQRLEPFGVDAVNIPENPLARARISSIALARRIYDQTGIESITHLTCRDRNLISLQAELLGAHVLGVNTILALTGDPSGIGDYPTATSVFDVDSLGLVEIMNRMNIGKDFGMNDLGAKTCFNIGVAANPLAKDIDAEMKRLERKLERGARFIQTQPIFDPASVEPFLKALEHYKVPVIFGVMPVRNYRHARFLINEYPGITIREKDLERFQKAEEDQQTALSIDFAAELMRELSKMSGGVYLMPGFGDSDRLEAVFRKFVA